jgi:hypothetical protein
MRMRNITARLTQDLLTKRAGAAVCDDCIADRLHFAERAYVNRTTRALASKDGFDRRSGRCSDCGRKKLVIRSVPEARE